MGSVSAAIVTALVFMTLCGPIQSDTMRLPRGVRGGEGDNSVEVVAAQGWRRHKAPPRELACRRDEVFQECGSACPRTCLSIRSPSACPNTCSVGCFCREGMVRDYSGRCIQEDHCP